MNKIITSFLAIMMAFTAFITSSDPASAHRRYRHGGDGVAVAIAAAAIIGGIAVSRSHRRHHRRHYYSNYYDNGYSDYSYYPRRRSYSSNYAYGGGYRSYGYRSYGHRRVHFGHHRRHW